MNRVSKLLSIAAASVALTGPAFAQDPPDGTNADPKAPANPDQAPTVGTLSPLTLGKGKILITGSTLNIGLSDGSAGEPISLAPAVYYGVSPKLTLGLTHDSGSTPWTPRPGFRTLSIIIPPATMPTTFAGGAGICLTGDDGGCSGVYDNVGVDALYSLKHGKFSLAGHGGFDIFSFDPFSIQLRVGVLGRYYINKKMSVAFDPRISLALNERDAQNDTIDLPVWFWYRINDKIGAYLSTGISGPFDGFGDAFAIPLQIGASYMVNAKITAGLDFAFTNLIGSGGGVEGRALGLRFAYAM